MAVATNPNDTALTPLSSCRHRISSAAALAPGTDAGAIAGPRATAAILVIPSPATPVTARDAPLLAPFASSGGVEWLGFRNRNLYGVPGFLCRVVARVAWVSGGVGEDYRRGLRGERGAEHGIHDATLFRCGAKKQSQRGEALSEKYKAEQGA